MSYELIFECGHSLGVSIPVSGGILDDPLKAGAAKRAEGAGHIGTMDSWRTETWMESNAAR
jgi:hypothetical protein